MHYNGSVIHYPFLLVLLGVYILFCGRDSRGVGLGSSGSHAKRSWGSLERAFRCLLSEEMDADELGVVDALETHEGLHEERLCVLHISVEEDHEAQADEDAAQLGGVSHTPATANDKTRTALDISVRS